ncbi:MAG: DUF4924 family protein [Bacteroidetes bacterium]|jgi:hypothetical protein|nr:DUF4924 family protein [Bacteroidota bacterium]
MKPLATTSPLEKVFMYWQTEDLLRAYQMDVPRLLEQRVFEHDMDGQDVGGWLENMARCMDSERVMEQGHTHHSTQILTEFDKLHEEMVRDEGYAQEYNRIARVIAGVMQRFPRALGCAWAMCEVVYSYYLMKLGKGQVADELESLCQQVAICLDMLSDKHALNA